MGDKVGDIVHGRRIVRVDPDGTSYFVIPAELREEADAALLRLVERCYQREQALRAAGRLPAVDPAADRPAAGPEPE